MLCRAVYAALILASCASFSGAENRGDFFRVPDPEEIFEAYRDGFIDYRDYRELLEITRHEFLSPDDSLLLLQFPDLLAGLSPHPLIERDAPDAMETSGQAASGPIWRHAALFRQYHRFNSEAACRRLYRLQSDYRRVQMYGEYEREYSGRRRWYRRSLAYTIGDDSGSAYSMVLGNFRERFGLGLIYGYHGRLVSVSEDATGSEQLLYPEYGGSNGILIEVDNEPGQYRFVFDTDRDDVHETRLTAVSAARRMGIWKIAVSAGRGEISNRQTGLSAHFGLFSFFGDLAGDGYRLIGEVAWAEDNGRRPMAAAVTFVQRRGRTRMRVDSWTYDGRYPSYFTGGPSSRRSRTVDIAEIAYSYSDRYRGETGIIVNAGYPLAGGMAMQTSLMYAAREFDDDRIEVRAGVDGRISASLRVEIDGYWRSDDLYTGETMRRRAQVELVHTLDRVRNRVVVGRRFDTDPVRDDYLVVLSSHLRGQWGSASGTVKLDRINPGEWSNRYLYATVQYEMQISRYISTYIKYSHRYLRDDPDASYGTFRWDVRWVIQ